MPNFHCERTPERFEAHENGETHYFTGVPCHAGHVSKRFTSSGACCECVTRAANIARKRAEKPPKIRKWSNPKTLYEKQLLNERCKIDYAQNATRERLRQKKYRDRNKAKVSQWKRNYYSRHKSKILAYQKSVSAKPEFKDRRNAKRKARIMNDPAFRVYNNLRSRLHRAIKRVRANKSASTRELCGCTPKQLKGHIESLFLEGMNWQNYGTWHVDHIRPCASFDLTLPQQQTECFHYSNLQPLWAFDNLSKAAKV